MRLFILSVTFFTIVSCGQQNASKNSQTTTDTLVTNQITSQPRASDILSNQCAVILSPTDKKIESLRNHDSESFYIVADDNMYYLSIAIKYLDSMKVKIINRTTEGNIKFLLSNGNETAVDVSGYYWGVLLFNGKDQPIKVDITDFESEFVKYMRTNK